MVDGVIILIIVGIVLYLILSAIMGTGFVMDTAVATGSCGDGGLSAKGSLVGSIGGVLPLPIPTRSLTVKRRRPEQQRLRRHGADGPADPLQRAGGCRAGAWSCQHGAWSCCPVLASGFWSRPASSRGPPDRTTTAPDPLGG